VCVFQKSFAFWGYSHSLALSQRRAPNEVHSLFSTWLIIVCTHGLPQIVVATITLSPPIFLHLRNREKKQ
jgi:hypothetical protein